ncbi:methionyl-tRNA formyltransferase [beta proteobacterium MWH-UniP1]
MRLVFAGTPEFARRALTALHQAGHDIVAVLTQPDRVSGRGLTLSMSPVKSEALRLGLPVFQPQSLRQGKPGAQETKEALSALSPELMVVAAYGLILPKEVLALPKFGCLNIHASLLPRWRGAAPIQRAIAAGDSQTGVALMQMEEGLDTGPVWQEEVTPIFPTDNFQSLHDRLADLGANSVVDLLKDFPPAGRQPTIQSLDGVVYAHKIGKEDGQIDWSMTSRQVCDLIRAFDPVPGAVTGFAGECVKLFDVSDLAGGPAGQALKNHSPGQIIQADKDGLLVACGQGAVRIGALQRPGGKRLGFREFLNGRRVLSGQQFETVSG